MGEVQPEATQTVCVPRETLREWRKALWEVKACGLRPGGRACPSCIERNMAVEAEMQTYLLGDGDG